jgi:hypothetical protein
MGAAPLASYNVRLYVTLITRVNNYFFLKFRYTQHFDLWRTFLLLVTVNARAWTLRPPPLWARSLEH